MTAMLTRTELMEPSMSTFSFSFLLMMTGCSRSSLLLLREETAPSVRAGAAPGRCPVLPGGARWWWWGERGGSGRT